MGREGRGGKEEAIKGANPLGDLEDIRYDKSC